MGRESWSVAILNLETILSHYILIPHSYFHAFKEHRNASLKRLVEVLVHLKLNLKKATFAIQYLYKPKMIGIMSAMREEIQALLNHLEHTEQYTKGKRDYYKGILFGKEAVLVFSRWGKVASATTATQLINDFDVDELIFTGVAGAIRPDLNIGDTVIGKQLVQHDMDASPLYDIFEIPLLHKTFFETHQDKRKQLTNACQLFIKNYTDVISKNEARNLQITDPKVVIGDITSGDQFISKQSQVSFITTHLESVVCAEMEGAAVAQVCYEYEVPFSIMRVISDKANSDAHVDFPLFVEQIASKYAYGIFKNYFQ